MTSLLRHILACNRHDPSRFVPLFVSGHKVGLVTSSVARHLAAADHGFSMDRSGLRFDAPSMAERSALLADAVETLQQAGLCPRSRGELFPVVERWGGSVLALVDRAACAVFGFPSFGLHVHGLVRDGEETSMWIGRRGLDRGLAPGALDNMIAGGQPHGLSLMENLVKEAAEEASLPPSLARTARPVGAVAYCQDQPPNGGDEPSGVKRDVLFIYELFLPPDVRPKPADDEVAGFALWPARQALRRAQETDDFKFNVPLTLIEFGIRHGLIGPDDPDYLALLRGLLGRTQP